MGERVAKRAKGVRQVPQTEQQIAYTTSFNRRRPYLRTHQTQNQVSSKRHRRPTHHYSDDEEQEDDYEEVPDLTSTSKDLEKSTVSELKKILQQKEKVNALSLSEWLWIIVMAVTGTAQQTVVVLHLYRKREQLK